MLNYQRVSVLLHLFPSNSITQPPARSPSCPASWKIAFSSTMAQCLHCFARTQSCGDVHGIEFRLVCCLGDLGVFRVKKNLLWRLGDRRNYSMEPEQGWARNCYKSRIQPYKSYNLAPQYGSIALDHSCSPAIPWSLVCYMVNLSDVHMEFPSIVKTY